MSFFSELLQIMLAFGRDLVIQKKFVISQNEYSSSIGHLISGRLLMRAQRCIKFLTNDSMYETRTKYRRRSTKYH
jgi:hypothetical protein